MVELEKTSKERQKYDEMLANVRQYEMRKGSRREIFGIDTSFRSKNEPILVN